MEELSNTPVLSPVVIFAYNRPTHLKKCLESLVKNKESNETQFWIFVDGPKNEDDQKKIEDIHKIIFYFSKLINIKTVFTKTNIGLAASIIKGVTRVIDEFEKIIVVEDDLILSPYFLEFCNNGLNKYAEEKRVASIHGYSTQFEVPMSEPYFLRGADCWGWATWKDRWNEVNWDSKDLLIKIKTRKLNKEFDLDHTFNYTDMLNRQSLGQVDSWAIRWHASMFLKNRLTLYPNRSLVQNDGMDGSGTHTSNSSKYDTTLTADRIFINNLEIKESIEARNKLKKSYRKAFKLRRKYSFVRIVFSIKRRLLGIFKT